MSRKWHGGPRVYLHPQPAGPGVRGRKQPDLGGPRGAGPRGEPGVPQRGRRHSGDEHMQRAGR